MEYLDLPDLSRAMATCRALYDLGIPILLRDVRLRRACSCGEHQSRFALYRRHLLKNPTRFAWVQSLSCPITALDDRIETPFRALPRNFTSIRSLEINMHRIEIDEYLSAWILSLEHLRNLRLNCVATYSPALISLIQRMGPRLQEFHVYLPFDMNLSVFHPLHALAGASRSLRSLSIECSNPSGGPAIVSGHDLTFPAVEDLQWTSSEILLTCDLVSSFPSLRRLRVENTEMLGWIPLHHATHSEEALLELRTHNRHVQNCSRMRWRSLDFLEGSSNVLWMLGIRCPVVRLKTSLCNDVRQKPGHTLAVLHDTWPEHLILAVAETCTAHNLERVLSFPSLRKVDLTFHVMDRKADTARILRLLVCHTRPHIRASS